MQNTPIEILHPLLRPGTPLQYDMLFPLELENISSKAGSSFKSSSLNEPALSPAYVPASIKIVFQNASWKINVTPSGNDHGYHGHNPHLITVRDVFITIYRHLAERVTPHSWNAASESVKDEAERSLQRRGGKTIRRVDWLFGKSLFAGLEGVHEQVEEGVLVFIVFFTDGIFLSGGY